MARGELGTGGRIWAAAAVGAAMVLTALGLALAWPRGRQAPPRSEAAQLVASTPLPTTSTGGRPAAPRQGGAALASRQPVTPEQQATLDEARRLREEGARMVRGRQYAEAEVPLRQAVALLDGLRGAAPDSDAAFAALYEQYRCYEVLGLYLEREEAFGRYVQTISERDGDRAAGCALVEDAHRLIGQHDLEAAARRLERALALTPSGPVAVAAHVLMGLAAEQQRLLDLAYSQYQEALELDPSPLLHAKIRRNMVSLNAGRGHLGAALTDARALCSLPEDAVPPQHRIVHECLLAQVHTRQGDTGKALQVLRGVIERYQPDETRYARLQLRALLERVIDAEVGE